MCIRDSISTVLIALSLFAFEWRMALAALWVIPVSAAIVVGSYRVQDKVQARTMAAKMACADGIQEYIETLRDLKASNAEQRYLSGLSGKIRAVEKQSIAAELETALFVSSASMVLKLGIASVALTGSVLLVQGSIDAVSYTHLLGEMPIDQAIIDGGITPYQLPFLVRKLLLARDVLSFKMAANSRKVLEAAFPPERFTPAGHDPKKEYDAMEAYLKTFSNRTIRNVFWSANNYALPKRSAKIGAKITYWYGDDEKKDRRRNIRFIQRYFPKARIHGIPKMAHAELVMVHPEKFCRYAEKFLTMQAEER